MSYQLRCPSCNEIISANSTQCKYCSQPLDQNTLYDEVLKFKHVTAAVSQANTIQSFNAGLIVVAILCAALIFAGMEMARRAHFHIFPYAMYLWVLTWFFRYGKLKSKDPELDPARAGVKRSALMWTIGVLIYTTCLVWVVVSFFMETNQLDSVSS